MTQIRHRLINERSDSSDSDDNIPLVELKRKYRRQRDRLNTTTNNGIADMDIGQITHLPIIRGALPYLETAV